uniref:Uncharacterized protein n=2 Tax=Sinocyclocheilus grahami TaxID=75366 RepID=A0A672NGY2_SINGR
MRSPNCKVEILGAPYFGYQKDGDHLLSGILLNPTHLRELKLLNLFKMSDRTVEIISQILMDPDCRLENLTLQGIETLESCKILAAALCSSSCRLQELDLSRCCRSSEDQALQLLSEAFRHPNFKITVLRLEIYSIKHEMAAALFSAFQENPSHLRKLELSFFLPLTLELQQLFSLLADPCFKLETLRIAHLRQLQADSLETLASVLGSCSLRSLDLSMCGLTDSSVELLSAGLSNPDCKLEILR